MRRIYLYLIAAGLILAQATEPITDRIRFEVAVAQRDFAAAQRDYVIAKQQIDVASARLKEALDRAEKACGGQKFDAEKFACKQAQGESQ